MKYSVLTYLIGEGVSNVFKNKRQTIISISMMCITMLIFGIFFVMGENLNHFVADIEQDQGIQVFMDEEATDEQIKKLKQELESIDGINTIDFVSKEQAFQETKDRFGEKANLLEGRDESIYPVSFIITFTDLSQSTQITNKIRELENVEEITDKDDVVRTLARIARGIKIGTYAISACLIVFAIFIITNTIRLTVHARRREISIMKYVGATNGFIRWPFAVEGMIIGVVSGAISVGVLSIVYSFATRAETFVQFLSSLGLTLLQFSDMLSLVIVVYLVLGIGVGILGSMISMRRYLKV